MKIIVLLASVFLLSGFQEPDTPKKTYTVSRTSLEVPSEKDCIMMANTSMGVLADAVIRKNFGDLYKFIAKRWSKQITKKQLAQAFTGFVKNQVDLTMALHTKPKFTSAPAIDSLGILQINLEYPTKPVKTVAAMRYLQEKNSWKLCGLSVNLQ